MHYRINKTRRWQTLGRCEVRRKKRTYRTLRCDRMKGISEELGGRRPPANCFSPRSLQLTYKGLQKKKVTYKGERSAAYGYQGGERTKM